MTKSILRNNACNVLWRRCRFDAGSIFEQSFLRRSWLLVLIWAVNNGECCNGVWYLMKSGCWPWYESICCLDVTTIIIPYTSWPLCPMLSLLVLSSSQWYSLVSYLSSPRRRKLLWRKVIIFVVIAHNYSTIYSCLGITTWKLIWTIPTTISKYRL